jgi:hypothetical protein
MTKARIQEFVIADSIRNPECAWHWMPDRVRHDKPILALREHLRQVKQGLQRKGFGHSGRPLWMLREVKMTKARIQEFVIADSIRNPGCAWHWMPDRVRHDKGAFAIPVSFGAHTFPGNRPASWATLAA